MVANAPNSNPLNMITSTKNNRLPPHIFERLKLAAQNDEEYQKYENDRRDHAVSCFAAYNVNRPE